MQDDKTKYFLCGAVIGVLLLVAPWWLSLAIVAIIAIKIWSGKNDGPTQA